MGGTDPDAGAPAVGGGAGAEGTASGEGGTAPGDAGVAVVEAEAGMVGAAGGVWMVSERAGSRFPAGVSVADGAGGLWAKLGEPIKTAIAVSRVVATYSGSRRRKAPFSREGNLGRAKPRRRAAISFMSFAIVVGPVPRPCDKLIVDPLLRTVVAGRRLDGLSAR